MAFSRIPLRARSLALVPLGALAVHELRYTLAFGDGAPPSPSPAPASASI